MYSFTSFGREHIASSEPVEGQEGLRKSGSELYELVGIHHNKDASL